MEEYVLDSSLCRTSPFTRVMSRISIKFCLHVRANGANVLNPFPRVNVLSFR